MSKRKSALTVTSSRYALAVRRSHLAKAAAAGALVLIPAACGDGDKATFEQSPTETLAPAPAGTEPALVESIPLTTEGVGTGFVVPASLEMSVALTYTAAAGGGRVHNPYIAVWIEDSNGNLVKTLRVWSQQTPKGQRYLRDLTSWYERSSVSAPDDTVSSPTRAPGSYTLVWDGTDASGNKVVEGDYVLLVEAAREKGPYSITSAVITLGSTGFDIALPDNSELSAVTARVTV